jgi:hypothetical protein
MTITQKILSAAMTILLGTGALVAAIAPASARVVCNAQGDCWHTDARVKYPPAVKAQVHNDDWYFHQNWTADNNRHYRDSHAGRGYYRSGLWIGF